MTKIFLCEVTEIVRLIFMKTMAKYSSSKICLLASTHKQELALKIWQVYHKIRN